MLAWTTSACQKGAADTDKGSEPGEPSSQVESPEKPDTSVAEAPADPTPEGETSPTEWKPLTQWSFWPMFSTVAPEAPRAVVAVDPLYLRDTLAEGQFALARIVPSELTPIFGEEKGPLRSLLDRYGDLAPLLLADTPISVFVSIGNAPFSMNIRVVGALAKGTATLPWMDEQTGFKAEDSAQPNVRTWSPEVGSSQGSDSSWTLSLVDQKFLVLDVQRVIDSDKVCSLADAAVLPAPIEAPLSLSVDVRGFAQLHRCEVGDAKHTELLAFSAAHPLRFGLIALEANVITLQGLGVHHFEELDTVVESILTTDVTSGTAQNAGASPEGKAAATTGKHSFVGSLWPPLASSSGVLGRYHLLGTERISLANLLGISDLGWQAMVYAPTLLPVVPDAVFRALVPSEARFVKPHNLEHLAFAATDSDFALRLTDIDEAEKTYQHGIACAMQRRPYVTRCDDKRVLLGQPNEFNLLGTTLHAQIDPLADPQKGVSLLLATSVAAFGDLPSGGSPQDGRALTLSADLSKLSEAPLLTDFLGPISRALPTLDVETHLDGQGVQWTFTLPEGFKLSHVPVLVGMAQASLANRTSLESIITLERWMFTATTRDLTAKEGLLCEPSDLAKLGFNAVPAEGLKYCASIATDRVILLAQHKDEVFCAMASRETPDAEWQLSGVREVADTDACVNEKP